MKTAFTSSAYRLGFAVADIDTAVAGWEGLGVGPWRTTRDVRLDDFSYRCSASDAVVHVAESSLGSLPIRLVQPADDAPSSYRSAVDRGTTALHDIGWAVDDLDAALATLESTEAGVLQAGSIAGTRFAAVGPVPGTGTVLELFQPSAQAAEQSAAPAAPTPGVPDCGPFGAPADQLGFVVPDLERAIDGWTSVGVGPWLTVKGARLVGYEYQGEKSAPTLDVAFAQLGPVQLELIRPDGERSSYRDFLDAGAQGLQHVGWFVDDLDAATRAATDQGGRVLQTGAWSGVGFAYFEPADGTGTITELIGMTSLSRDLFAMIRERASVVRWDGRTDPSRNILLAADWGLRWEAVRAQLSDLLRLH